MKALVNGLVTAAVVLAAPGGTAVAEGTREFGAAYYARETNGTSDNDILRLTYARSLPWDGRTGYFGLAAGFRNEFWGDIYPVHLQAEGARYLATATGRHGFGARVTWADGYSFSAELTYGAERWFRKTAIRGLAGIQAADDPILGNGDRLGWFALAEFSYYPAERVALRLGAMLQEADPLGTIGFEVMPFRTAPVSIYMDWTVSPGNFREFGNYNDLVGGVRWVFGGDNLQERDRVRPSRLMYRPVDVY